jgi:hypothetical protein
MGPWDFGAWGGNPRAPLQGRAFRRQRMIDIIFHLCPWKEGFDMILLIVM